MAEAAQEQAITFNGKEYLLSSLSDESRRYIDHLIDLGKKIYQAELDLQQYRYIDQQFNTLLSASLEVMEEVSE